MAKKKDKVAKVGTPIDFNELVNALKVGSIRYACAMTFYNKEWYSGGFIYRNGVYTFFCMADNEDEAFEKAHKYAVAKMVGWYYSVGNVRALDAEGGLFSYIEDVK